MEASASNRPMSEQDYRFDDPQSLLGIANQPALQADEKPLLTFAEDDPDNVDSFDDVEFVDGHKLVYNPATGTAFGTATDEYEIINPPEFVGPLVEQLIDRDRTDVEGDVWVRNDGASGYAQLLFRQTDAIWLPNRGNSNPVRCGFQLWWAHDQGLSVRAEGFAQDTACSNSMREVTSGVHVKHSGDVDGRVDWDDEWATVLDELGAFSEALAELIEDAMQYELIDFGDFDVSETWLAETGPLDTLEETNPVGPLTEDDRDGMHALYELLGLPQYLATAAARRLVLRLSQKDDPRIVSAWDAYSAATYALTHEGRGTPGASDDRHHRTVSDILLNPHEVIGMADREARSRATPDDAAPVIMEGEAEGLEETTGDALRQYSERARQLEQSFGG